jgi:hypothetical protein
MALAKIHEEGLTGRIDFLEAFTKYHEAVKVTASEAEKYPDIPDNRPRERRDELVRKHINFFVEGEKEIAEEKKAVTTSIKDALTVAGQLGFQEAVDLLKRFPSATVADPELL